jgi:hypothetical protein
MKIKLAQTMVRPLAKHSQRASLVKGRQNRAQVATGHATLAQESRKGTVMNAAVTCLTILCKRDWL